MMPAQDKFLKILSENLGENSQALLYSDWRCFYCSRRGDGDNGVGALVKLTP